MICSLLNKVNTYRNTEFDSKPEFIGIDYASTADSTTFSVFSNGKFEKITRKEYFIQEIKEQPYF